MIRRVDATMCSSDEGCFLIRTYKKVVVADGHEAALMAAAKLYQETDTEASLTDAIEFVSRFVIPGVEPPTCPMVC